MSLFLSFQSMIRIFWAAQFVDRPVVREFQRHVWHSGRLPISFFFLKEGALYWLPKYISGLYISGLYISGSKMGQDVGLLQLVWLREHDGKEVLRNTESASNDVLLTELQQEIRRQELLAETRDADLAEVCPDIPQMLPASEFCCDRVS